MIPSHVRPSREATMFLDFLDSVCPWAVWYLPSERIPGPRKTLRQIRSKFLSMICKRSRARPHLRWDKRTLRRFRRETWEPWMRASIGIEIDITRFRRACKNPKAVPYEDIVFVRRRWGIDPLSKQSVYG